MDLSKKYYKFFTILNNIFTSIYFVFAVIILITALIQNNIIAILQSLTTILLIFVPKFISLISKIKLTSDVTFVYQIFCMLAMTIGCTLKAYGNIPYYDKIIHTFSGILIFWLGIIIYRFIKNDNKELSCSDFLTLFSYSLFFDITISVIWEFFEYFMLVFFGIDAVHFYDTGMTDTMTDIFVCFIGAIISSVILYNYLCKNKKPIFIKSIFNICHKTT